MSANLFSDLKVVDAASFLAGPCAATILSDYGADVIKVEPLGGDGHRRLSGKRASDWSWQLTNRNKRTMAMDITTAQGYDLLMRLIADADVFVVNFTAGQLERYGLTWAALRKINKRSLIILWSQ